MRIFIYNEIIKKLQIKPDNIIKQIIYSTLCYIISNIIVLIMYVTIYVFIHYIILIYKK